ncbi:hypothetical protein CBR_g4349 [Chara braunii]|uniref:Retrotransposon gag domain-containing protein n=1 Tax=Chara braunii TaxID=69332 RepID=A0A388JRG8_CHABU|nr:hypothetical protein CBR_g4349 [Chara braunii]|eukprot:GBG60391.1 hypothetical protein CBR_g4349 [Chara braunii]
MSARLRPWVLPRRSPRIAALLSRQQQSAARIQTPTVPRRRRTMILPAFPVQGTNEASDVFLQRVQAFMDLAAAEQERIAAAAAEQQRLPEEPAGARSAPTAEEQEKAELAYLLRHLLRTVNWQQKQLRRHAQAAYQQQQILKASTNDFKTLATAINSAKTQQQQVNDALTLRLSTVEAQAHAPAAPPIGSSAAGQQWGPRVAAIESTTTTTQCIDHIISLIGEVGQFQAPTTLSNQVTILKAELGQLKSRPDSCRAFKMPKFNVAKFDDYRKTDALAWWTAFNTEADVHHVPDDQRLDALYLQLISGSQAFMNNLALQKACTIATLHTKITWDEFEQLWQTRFMVRNVKKTVMNELYHWSQGNYAYPRMVDEVEKFDLRRSHSRANILIQTDRWAANESRQRQPAYVAKPGFQWHNANVILTGSQEDHAAATASGEGDVVAAIPPRRTRARKKKATTQAPEGAGQLPWTKYHISEEVYHLRLNTSSMTDDGVAVVDIHAYLAKIDRTHASQRYVKSDAPLLYIRIQIGKETCNALIDFGASRNYMSQAFMARAGLDPRVRRKTPPTYVTLTDGHTQKLIDRFVDGIPVYFAPLACEPVSFDILDTKLDMILGMSWLPNPDHAVNFHHRTVHVRDRNRELVPCTVPPPHTSIGCHVVSAARIRNAITQNNVDEMGICFLHALPPTDEPKTSSLDPCIIQLLDGYGDVFAAPAGTVPDRPTHHGIALEDSVIPPGGCIHRMSEEELKVDDDLQQLFVNGYKSNLKYSTLYADLSSDHTPAGHYRITDGYGVPLRSWQELVLVPFSKLFPCGPAALHRQHSSLHLEVAGQAL